MISKILTEKITEQLYTDNWPRRRRWMMWTILWLGGNAQGIVLWAIWTGSVALLSQLAFTLIGAILSIITFYIFGAVWDDTDKRSKIAATPKKEGE